MANWTTKHSKKGFTLIELLVVILILGVLAALIVPSFLDRAQDARITAAKTDISTLKQALSLYKLDNGNYPEQGQGLQALSTKPTTGVVPGNWRRYIEKLPNDPWGNAYQYLKPGTHGSDIDLFSLGADGKPGGEGADADIGSWE